MAIIKISQLFIYPVKSLAGIAVPSAKVTEKGLEHDRRWMLVDDENRFLTQREYPQLALLQPNIDPQGLRIRSLRKRVDPLFIPFIFERKLSERVTIWNATCDAYSISSEINAWFSAMIGIPCKLVYMPDDSKRPVDTSSGQKPAGKYTSFSDAYPFMLISKESIDDLNKRSGASFSIKRFRPNIVISGGLPYGEDQLSNFQIGDVQFKGIEQCARCSVPNIDPRTGIASTDQEPTRTLANYRRRGNNIYLGMNLVHTGSGKIQVGDELITKKLNNGRLIK